MDPGDNFRLASRCEFLGPFVGRGAELHQLGRLLVERRLVTVVGPPGVGKTRLALQFGADLGVTAAGQVCLVELGELARSSDVTGVVSAALGVGLGRNLDRALAGRDKLLIILDNCEHLLEACQHVVGAIVAARDGPRVLATSQVPLGAKVEAVFRLAPLSLPEAGESELPEVFVHSEAVQLFCARAEAAGARLLPRSSNAAAIVEVCRRLDGLPLAIELAAPLVVALPPEAMADCLRRGLGLPWHQWPDDPARHHSPEAALSWSEDLLTDAERVVLCAVSVFASTFDVEMAQAVCADDVGKAQVSSSLATLTQRSLLLSHGSSTQPRYRLIETMRPILGAELRQSPQGPAVHARHARWCLDLVHAAGDTARDQGWRQRLGIDPAEVTVALQWALEAEDAEAAFALVSAEVALCRHRGEHVQARDWLERVVALKGPATASLRAQVLLDAGGLAAVRGDVPSAIAHLRHSAAAYRSAADHQGAARALSTLGFVSLLSEHNAAGLHTLDEGVAAARPGGEKASLAEALAACGRGHLLVGEVGSAEEAFSESLALARQVDHLAVAADALAGMGQAALVQGRYRAAASSLAEALATSRQVDETHTAAVAVASLGELARLHGNEEEAAERFEECVTLAREAHVPYPLSRALLGQGRLAQARGQLSDADRRFEEALVVADRAGIARMVSASFLALGEVSLSCGAFGPARAHLDKALSEARSAADKLGQGAALFSLGWLARAQGEPATALSLHHQALELRSEVGERAGIADSLEALAGLAVHEADVERAVRLFAAAQALRQPELFRPPWLQEGYEADRALARRGLDPKDFQAAWARGEALTAERAVALALGKGEERPRRRRVDDGLQALTKMERRVAALVGEGMTNREVAERLFISHRTVGNHLQNIFARLGIRSRRELRHLRPYAPDTGRGP